MNCDNDSCDKKVVWMVPIAEITFKKYCSVVSEFIYCSAECAIADLKNLDITVFEE